jgi:LPXTG-site transpeptidase (sortase) family protein
MSWARNIRLRLPAVNSRGRALVLAGVVVIIIGAGVAVWPKSAPNPYARYGYGPDGLPMAGAVLKPLPSPDATAQAVINDVRDATTVPVVPTDAVAALDIPALHLRVVPIYDRGLDSHRRMLIAGGYSITHYANSGPLGGSSNAVLYGHDDIEGGVFGHLKDLKPGDAITIHMADGRMFQYKVRDQKLVLPSAVSILAPTSTPVLTLFSCYPLWVDNQRIVVTAVPA